MMSTSLVCRFGLRLVGVLALLLKTSEAISTDKIYPLNPMAFEIPLLPTRFVVKFVYNGQYKGRWVYDYGARQTLVEFLKQTEEGEVVKTSFFANYLAFPPQMQQWTSRGLQLPAKIQQKIDPDEFEIDFVTHKCLQWDMPVPRNRMWSPSSLRKLIDSNIDTELPLTGASIAVLGVSVRDGSQVMFQLRGNGSFVKTAINGNEFIFSAFQDLSTWDKVRASLTSAVAALHGPHAMCFHQGSMKAQAAAMTQRYLPFLLIKPSLDSDKGKTTGSG